MGRRPIRTADEQDACTGWKKFYCYLARAGVSAGIKAKANRRDRRIAKRTLWEGWR